MLLSEVAYGATLAYSPRGITDTSRASKRFTLQIKQNKVVQSVGTTAADYVARKMRERRGELPFEDRFADAVLVPMPRAALARRGALWPAREVANALLKNGFGVEIRTLIERATPIRKSATAEQRPTAGEQLRSMVATDMLPIDAPVVLVDDVVTRGATLLAAASLVMPMARDVFAFAVARTVSQGELDDVFAPVVGTIRLRGEVPVRDP